MMHIVLYFLALFSLSLSPNWAKLNHMPAEMLGFYRLLGATVLLFFYFLFVKKQKPHLQRGQNLRWAFVSGFFFFLHLWSYKYAAKTTLVANLMILFATNPVWASVGSWLFFKEKLTRRIVFSYVLAFCGTLILVFERFELNWNQFAGNAVAVLSALVYAAYMLSSKKARQKLSNTDYAFVQYSLTAVLFGVVSFINKTPFTGYDQQSWMAVVGLIATSTFLGHFSLTYLVQFMNINVMTCGKLIEPVLASIVAYYLFHETLAPQAYLAFALTVTAVLVLFWPKLKTLGRI